MFYLHEKLVEIKGREGEIRYEHHALSWILKTCRNCPLSASVQISCLTSSFLPLCFTFLSKTSCENLMSHQNNISFKRHSHQTLNMS